MTDFKHLRRICITLLGLLALAGSFRISAQNPKFQNPRQEILLNQFKVLIWNLPNSEKTTFKLRIHKGAAFDSQGKEGTMALLANIFFPDEVSREFFEQDLGGRLQIVSNYDYLQINATAAPDQLVTVLQTLANAVISPQIDKDTTSKVLAAQFGKVKELEIDPAYAADLAVSKRLFGSFPYGRPQAGTVESLAKIDFADLIFARQRLLTADNATLVVSGSVNSDLVYRAVRRYFGGWTKADASSPANFRLPEIPDKAVQLIETARENTDELRLAIRGSARNDKDYYASEILALILKSRLQKSAGPEATVENHTYFLPGMVLFKLRGRNTGETSETGAQAADASSFIRGIFKDPVSSDEFNSARTEVLKRFNMGNLTDLWLDVDTYRLGSFNDDYQNAQNVTLEGVRTLAGNWAKSPIASVLLYHNAKPAETREDPVQ